MTSAAPEENPDWGKGQSVKSERSRSHLLRELNVICVIAGLICNMYAITNRAWRHV